MFCALENVIQIGRRRDATPRIADDQIRMSLQRLQSRLVSLKRRHCGEDLQHAHKHSGAAASVLTDQVAEDSRAAPSCCGRWQRLG